jgi:hypothetical protein
MAVLDHLEQISGPSGRERLQHLSASGHADLESAELRTTEWLVDLLSRLDATRLVALAEALDDLRALASQEQESPPAVP